MAQPKMAMAVAAPVAKVAVAAPVAKSAAPAPAPKASAPVAAVAVVAPALTPTATAVAASSPVGAGVDLDGDGEIDARIVMDCPLTKAYLLDKGAKKLVENGVLQVLAVEDGGKEVYLLLLGSIQIALREHVPCLKMASRDFVFPTDGNTYGILLADTITDDVLEVFNGVIAEHTSFRAAEPPQRLADLPDKVEKITGVANTVAAGLGAGSVVVATGVVKGGKLVGSLLLKGGNYLTQKLRPNAEATKISDERKARLAKAKMMSGAAVKVSKALVIGAMATTQVMATQLSEAIKETDVGKKLSSEPEKPNANLEAAKVVGKATVGAVLTVYEAIEQAVFGVAHDASAATVTVVSHKYGTEAGQHTKESLGVVENVAVAASDMKKLGVKSIAKATALKTGEEVLTTDAEREAKRQQQLAAAGPMGAARQGLGHSMGLPEGMDPLVAMEAMQAVSTLSSAAHAQGASSGSTQITTATATGATPAQAIAAASAAAHA